MAVTYDGRHLRTYLDGQKIGEKAQRGALGGNGSAPAFFGSSAGKEVFEGAIDEVEVHGVALSDQQVASLAGGSRGESFPLPAGYWRFDGSVDNEIVGEVRLPKNQVVLVGGTLISRMDKYGYFEHAATVSWPHHDISFRNLGWAADDVFGTARSEFGSAHNTRSWQPPKNQRGFGFEKLRAQLAETDPATIIVG